MSDGMKKVAGNDLRSVKSIHLVLEPDHLPPIVGTEYLVFAKWRGDQSTFFVDSGSFIEVIKGRPMFVGNGLGIAPEVPIDVVLNRLRALVQQARAGRPEGLPYTTMAALKGRPTSSRAEVLAERPGDGELESSDTRLHARVIGDRRGDRSRERRH
jgi:hypothetical protein